MSLLHTLRTVRAMRVVALLGYLLVVATSGVTPWMQPMAFGNICSAAGNDTDRDHGIGCALCLPAAAPPQCTPVASLAHEPADADRFRVGGSDHDTEDGLNATMYRLRRRVERATPKLFPLQSKSRVGYQFRATLKQL